jgi:hypothetical protein
MISKIKGGDYLKRLDNIKQWQEKDVVKEESVSQHSYKVTVFARILLEDTFGKQQTVEILNFKLGVTTQAIFHDWDESLIRRDLSHDIKYNNFNGTAVREVLRKLTNHLAENEFSIADALGTETPASTMLIECIKEPDVDIKLFVKLCDWLAASFYINRELSLGNFNFTEVKVYCDKNIKSVSIALIEVLKLRFADDKLNFKSLENL